MFELPVGNLVFTFLGRLSILLLDGAFMLSPQVIHLLALGDELGAELVFDLGIDLELLSQLLKDFSKVTSTEGQQLSELLLALAFAEA